jgi:hypothetical protein
MHGRLGGMFQHCVRSSSGSTIPRTLWGVKSKEGESDSALYLIRGRLFLAWGKCWIRILPGTLTNMTKVSVVLFSRLGGFWYNTVPQKTYTRSRRYKKQVRHTYHVMSTAVVGETLKVSLEMNWDRYCTPLPLGATDF